MIIGYAAVNKHKRKWVGEATAACAILVAGTILLSGCTGSRHIRGIPAGTGPVPAGPPNTVVVKPLGKNKTLETYSSSLSAVVTKEGNRKITESELGVPVYPGATLRSTAEFGPIKGLTKRAAQRYDLITSASLDKVVAFYKSRLPKAEYHSFPGVPSVGLFRTRLANGSEVNIDVVSKGKMSTLIMVGK